MIRQVIVSDHGDEMTHIYEYQPDSSDQSGENTEEVETANVETYDQH